MKTNDKNDEEHLLEIQNNALFKLHDQLKGVKKRELITLLEVNDQAIPKGHAEVCLTFYFILFIL